MRRKEKKKIERKKNRLKHNLKKKKTSLKQKTARCAMAMYQRTVKSRVQGKQILIPEVFKKLVGNKENLVKR